jgi:exopolysaccharide biosynthesis predicted pyruvyltransferase EpsI
MMVIKKILPIRVKRMFKPFFERRELYIPDGKRIFIFLAADYGNIGDLAIAAAQARFLAEHGSSRTVVAVPISATRALLRSIRNQATAEDLITVVGGGNMGSLYPDIEELRQLVISSFPQNRIVCFPQTLDWNDSEKSRRALARIVRVYAGHPDLHVFAREAITKEKLETLFRPHANVHVGYTPDIVLSATVATLGSTNDAAPSGLLLCLRDDRERALGGEQRGRLEAALADTGLPLEITDTHAGGAGLDEASCARLLADKINQFRAARLVVTDRLHGMILSAVAGTPCLVLPNANHKIHQTWLDWLTDVPQVKFVKPEDMETLPEVLKALLATPRRDPARSPVSAAHYQSLALAIAHA